MGFFLLLLLLLLSLSCVGKCNRSVQKSTSLFFFLELITIWKIAILHVCVWERERGGGGGRGKGCNFHSVLPKGGMRERERTFLSCPQDFLVVVVEEEEEEEEKK